jgi:hypothetical protein
MGTGASAQDRTYLDLSVEAAARILKSGTDRTYDKTNDSDQPLWNFAVVAILPYFSTTRFKEIVPDPV